MLVALGMLPLCAAQSKPAAPAANASADVLVLGNGDTLHGKLVSEAADKVTFHSDSLGDVAVSWDKIKELHATERFAVLDKTMKLRGKKSANQIPAGTLEVADQTIVLQPENGAPAVRIPTKNAQYILDEATLKRQANHEPGFFAGWNGAATAGATLVSATENQYTVSGGVSLVRAVPEVGWLDPRNRTTADFTGSFGKITQPAYTVAGNPAATPPIPPSTVAAVITETAIYHAGAERDEYIARHFFGLAQTAFDHNFSQNLALQQIYGGGVGWTAIKTPKQELDVKGTLQYESQEFLATAATAADPTPPPPTPNMNLIGSTFSASYALHLKMVTYTQALSFIPSYNEPHAYSANETDTLAFPAFKDLSFSVGTLDSYLDDAPLSEPPTKPNSFQFTMGLTYAIKPK